MKVQVKNDRQLVSARDLHKGLGLKEDLADGSKLIQNYSLKMRIFTSVHQVRLLTTALFVS